MDRNRPNGEAFSAVFKVADEAVDEVLMRLTKEIFEPTTVPDLTTVGSLDMEDVRAIAERGGVAMIGMGEGEGPSRMEDAASRAMRSPLNDGDIRSATAALVNISAGPGTTLADVENALKQVTQMISPDAHIIWGVQIHPEMEGFVRVLVILTGIIATNI
ncbi:MAG: hypothetical protein LBV40_07455 [Methanomicrobiales archaeon]|jgi:cell division protein FtsZ|nr:hypothetical protein [Methanomicrobiales archaeon]